MTRLASLLVAAALILSGCSGMSKKDCINADWYNMGLQDGSAGFPVTQINNYVAMCSDHDVPVNRTDYQRGHEQGIVQFCQPSNGYQLGLSGRSLPNVCPANLAEAFAAEHERGYQEFQIQRDINNAQSAISQANAQVTQLEQQLLNATAQLYAAVNESEKQSAQQRVDELNRSLLATFEQKSQAVGQLACANANWYTAGVTDARDGRAVTLFENHRRSCQPYHPTPNANHYRQGHADGVVQYCSYENGLALGKRGRDLASFCSGSGLRAVQSGHQDGLAEYQEKLTIAGLQQQTQSLEKQLPSLLQTQEQLQARLANDALSSADRLELTRQLNAASREYNTALRQFQLANTELNCYIGDWQSLGFEDAERGLRANNTSVECRAFGIVVDENQYDIGYALGLPAYCTPYNGAALGAAGAEYLGICPVRLEGDFLAAYEPAYQAFMRDKLRRELSQEQRTLSEQLSELTEDINILTGDLDQPGLTRAERLALITAIADLSEREERLSRDLGTVNQHVLCLTEDWLSLGQQHGGSGQANQVRELNCQRFELDADEQAYRRGFERGLDQWCTEANGYQLGLTGAANNAECSRTRHRDFHFGYINGRTEYLNPNDP